MPEVSAVVPAWNEAAHLRGSLLAIGEALAQVSNDYEVVVVDDGSGDATWSTVTQLHREDERFRGLRLARHCGKEGAVAAGLEHARGEAVIVLDADLQHPLDMLPEFYKLWKEQGIEVVHGVKRSRRGEPLLRRAFSGLFAALATLLTGIRFDRSADFKLLDRKVVDAWLAMPERRTFFRGMVAWLGFRSREVPFTVQARVAGGSTFRPLGLARLAWHAITSYSYMPLRIIHLLAAAFLAFSFLLGAWALYLWAEGRAVSGFTTVIILELMIGGCVLLSLAIIAEYLAAIYEETKQRPRYVISETT